jgi:hypothetical protein
MRRRRGRPRKAGARHRDGHLKRQAESPRVIAAGMPHRRGLGELAVDQRAETELGRLTLRGALTEAQGLAGETYLALWRGYVFSLAGPSELSNGGGHGFTCDGCATAAARKWCRCEFRRRIFLEAQGVLRELGTLVLVLVEHTVIHGWPGAGSEPQLQLGLSALAIHFGLQPRKTMISRNAASEPARSPHPDELLSKGP